MSNKTELKNLEEILSSSKIVEFIDAQPYPFYLFDHNEKLLHANKSKYISSAFSAKLCSLSRSDFSKSLIHSNEKHEEIIFDEDSHVSYKKVTGRMRLFNHFYYFVSLNPIEDIEQPLAFENELEVIIDSVQDGIYITDEKGFTLRINKAYSELTGITKKEVIGKHVSELLSDGYFDSSVSIKVMQNKQPVSILQHITDKNGKNRILLVSGRPIFDKNGELKRCVNTVYDMTELNNLRETLKEQSLALHEERNKLETLRNESTKVPGIIASSKQMRTVMTKIQHISKTDISVLILGETGTGKNQMAKAIHNLSDRKNKNFIEINCGAIPEQLIESELFGYEKGAFSGASTSGKKGLIEAADQGTLFLDEIGEMPLHLQVKLLTFLQDQKIRRVGGVEESIVNVRIIAATNKDPKQLVAEKKLREDLYYRLSVAPIQVPSLRNRKEDIFTLAEYFRKEFNNKYNKQAKYTKPVIITFENYDWPGNIRELKHTIEHLIVLSQNNLIELEDLPSDIRIYGTINQGKYTNKDLKSIVNQVEKEVILDGWKELKDITLLADRLGMHRTTLIRKIQKLNFELKY